MHRSTLALSLLGLVAAAACSDAPVAPSAAPAANLSASPAAGRYLVLTSGSAFRSGFASTVAALGGKVEFAHRSGLAVVSGLDDAAAASLRQDTTIISVQPDAEFQLDVIADASGVEAMDPVAQSQTDPTTAIRYPRQWSYGAVSAPAAWAAGKLGSSGVRVAILDTGIDYTYPDLNGLVDLSRSTSFATTDNALVSTYFPGKNSCTDLHYHGTHVASTVSSKATYIAGMTSRTTLMCVKVLNVNGNGAWSWILQGVLWAVDNGADVINMSLGGSFAKAGEGRFVGELQRTYNYAFRKGVTVVVSAGNDEIDLDHDGNSYKAQCSAPNVICVAATGPTSSTSVNGPWTNIDAPAYYTNYGRSAINVAAPGGNTGGFVWQACSQTSLQIPVCQTGIFVLGAAGTSMAAPHVSGLAALLVEQYGRNPAQIRAVLQKSADDLGPVGVDPYYGQGRINVKTALGL